VGIARNLAIDQHFETDRFTVSAWPEHQMQVAGMEAVNDTTGRCAGSGTLGTDMPLTAQAPVIECQFVAGGL
jgi:hypothetical protein